MKSETMAGDILGSYLGNFYLIWRFETSFGAILDLFEGVSLWIWVEISIFFKSPFFFRLDQEYILGMFSGFKGHHLFSKDVRLWLYVKISIL